MPVKWFTDLKNKVDENNRERKIKKKFLQKGDFF